MVLKYGFRSIDFEGHQNKLKSLKTKSNMFKYYSLIPVQERRFSYGKIPRSGETVAQ